MTVIVCLDNANGMMFNHRRQSRDANVVKDILKTINGASLLIAPYRWKVTPSLRLSSEDLMTCKSPRLSLLLKFTVET